MRLFTSIQRQFIEYLRDGTHRSILEFANGDDAISVPKRTVKECKIALIDIYKSLLPHDNIPRSGDRFDFFKIMDRVSFATRHVGKIKFYTLHCIRMPGIKPAMYWVRKLENGNHEYAYKRFMATPFIKPEDAREVGMSLPEMFFTVEAVSE